MSEKEKQIKIGWIVYEEVGAWNFDSFPESFREAFSYQLSLKKMKEAGERIDIKCINHLQSLLSVPKWSSFYGYNNIVIPDFELKCGGGVGFKKHLFKPLSDALWEDLILRLQVKSMQIYRHNDAIPCVATMPKSVQITLDEDETVLEIYYTP